MIEPMPTPPETTTKKRRTAAELKAYLLDKAKQIDDRQRLRVKKDLQSLADEAKYIAASGSLDPRVAQASDLLKAAADAIKVDGYQ